MVNKKLIEKTLNDIIDKCSGYIRPSQRVSNFNINDFHKEIYSEGQDDTNRENKTYYISPVGELQQKQQDLQDNTDYSAEEKQFMKNFHWDSYWYHINQFLNNNMDDNTKDFVLDENGNLKKNDVHIAGELTMGPPDYPPEKQFMGYHNSYNLSMDINDIIKKTSDVIDKSPRLVQDTVFYRYGEWTPNLKTGDWGNLKGFLSCTYNPFVAEDSIKGANWVDSNRYNMRVFALKGTKGMVMDSNNFGTANRYSEWMLDNNQRFVVLNQDDTNHTVDILIY